MPPVPFRWLVSAAVLAQKRVWPRFPPHPSVPKGPGSPDAPLIPPLPPPNHASQKSDLPALLRHHIERDRALALSTVTQQMLKQGFTILAKPPSQMKSITCLPSSSAPLTCMQMHYHSSRAESMLDVSFELLHAEGG